MLDKLAAVSMDSGPGQQTLQKKSGLAGLCEASGRDFTCEILVIRKGRVTLALALDLYRSKRLDTAIMESRVRGG